MEIDYEKLNKIARELGIEVNEDSDKAGLFYRDKDGNLVKWNAQADFNELLIISRENKINEND